MNVFKTTKKLIQKELIMLRSKIVIRLDYLVKIRFHQLKNDIDISKFPPWRRKHNMFYFYNIWMTKQSKELNFSQNPCGIRNMFKNIINFLNCNPFSSMAVNCRTDNTITSLPNNFLNLVSACLSILCEEFCF